MIRSCKEVQEHLAAYVDGHVEDGLRMLISEHVQQCSACRHEIDGQTSVRRQMQALKRRQENETPANRIWANASQAWERQDGIRRRRVQLRLALVAASMLLMVFGTVWARLTAGDDFPVQAVLRDFRAVRAHTLSPKYKTADADQAARWLRIALDGNVPPVDLSLSGGALQGADIIEASGMKVGRLLYQTPKGIVGIYIAPRGVHFTDIPTVTLEGDSYSQERKAKDIGLYGWNVGPLGYAVVLAQPIKAGVDTVKDARRNSMQPLH